MKDVIRENKLINAKRQGPNLKKILTRAKFTDTNTPFKSFKCGDKRCKCCDNIIEATSFTFPNSNIKHEMRANMNCNTKNCIYALFCNSCQLFYIGETSTEIRSRVTVHRQQIETISHVSLHVSKHIAQCARSLYPKFKILPIYKMKTDSKHDRLKMEEHFISKLRPQLNR